MPDRLAISRSLLGGIVALLVISTAIAAGLLYFAFSAPVVLVLLVACLMPGAMVLLLYIGYLLRHDPQRQGYIFALKGLALLSVAMGLLVLLDFALPTSTVTTDVKEIVPREDEAVLDFGVYRKSVPVIWQKACYEGLKAELEITPLFHQVDHVTLCDSGGPEFGRPWSARVLMIIGGLAFLLPVGLLRFSPSQDDPWHNTFGYFSLVAPSYVLSLVAAGLWVKVLLVHVFRTLPTM